MSALDILRERYPNQEWFAKRDGFGWRYTSDEGWTADWRSVLTPQYPDDDETAVARLFVYEPGEPAKMIL